MRDLKKLFVSICTTLMMLLTFLLFDLAFAGLIYLLISIWSKVVALNVFKWVVLIMFGLQVLLTIPVAIKGYKGDE